MKRVVRIVAALGVATALVGWFAYLAFNGRIDVLRPAGDVAAQQLQLLIFTLSLSALIVLPVFTLLIVFSFRYRANRIKPARYEPDWGENTVLESLWWGIPIVIIGILAVVTFQTSHSLDPHKQLAGKNPLTIQVVALQWKWLFLYPEQNVATLNYVALPVHRPVTFKLTADAPMSAFWIPSLGSQTYAMNGMASTLNLNATKIGEYSGYATNINGPGYAKMTFKAKAMSPSGFDTWLKQASSSRDVLSKSEFNTLSKPKSETDQRTFRVQDGTIFESLTDHKNMNHEANT